ncbi:hypothetical protein SH449x_004076 [Pirellulaceae bacterium SH449]
MTRKADSTDAVRGKACLVCGDLATNLKRGLCLRHYEQFRRKRDSLKPEAADAWELQLIESGKLLPKQQGKKFGIDDPFAESFAAFVASTPDAMREESATPKEILESAVKKTAEHRKKPKS